jgi:hypothetical protein
MGVIESLTDLNWETVEPKKAYKFSPEYFLTMGKRHLISWNFANLLGLQNTTINHITHIDKLYLSRLAARRKILQDHPNAIACLPSAVGMVTSSTATSHQPTSPAAIPPSFTSRHLAAQQSTSLTP